jgi:hypothetical protein
MSDDDHSQTVETSGGAFIQGSVNIGDGEFVGRDKNSYETIFGDKIEAVTYIKQANFYIQGAATPRPSSQP